MHRKPSILRIETGILTYILKIGAEKSKRVRTAVKSNDHVHLGPFKKTAKITKVELHYQLFGRTWKTICKPSTGTVPAGSTIHIVIDDPIAKVDMKE